MNMHRGRSAAALILCAIVPLGLIGVLRGSDLSERLPAPNPEPRRTLELLIDSIEQYHEETGAWPPDDIDVAALESSRRLSQRYGCASLVEAFDGDGYDDGPGAPYIGFHPEDFSPGDYDRIFRIDRPSGVHLLDPWGRPYRYRRNDGRSCPCGAGLHAVELETFDPRIHVMRPDEYDLWSPGPDGRDGTEDDLCNWKH